MNRADRAGNQSGSIRPHLWLKFARRDLADVVIHWTKAKLEDQPPQEASAVLDEILSQSCLQGGDGEIRGSHSCVCFTEAPLAEMVAVFVAEKLIEPRTRLRYEPFGVGVRKDWLFPLGGRPVIYQSEEEYSRLPAEFQWRHCRYEPPRIDFTWEREWRIQEVELIIEPAQTWVFVPTVRAADELAARHPKWRIVPLVLFGFPGEE